MLNDRKLMILKMIIDDFITTGSPVGSRTISKKPELMVSSATIRNEMSDLEDLGYLYQPHTSAGRVPSSQAFRLYVDSLISRDGLASRDKQRIRELLMHRKIKVEEVIDQATRLLADLTGLAVMISLPKFKGSRLANMKLVKVSEAKALLILVSDSGIVKSLELAFSGSDQQILDLISDSLLHSLQGATIDEINLRNISKLKYKLREFEEVFDYLVPILKETMKSIDDIEANVCGLNNLLSHDDFSEVETAKTIIGLLEDKATMKALLEVDEGEGIQVKIGEEIGLPALSACSIIRGSYRYRNNELGRIVVIGPTRMDYRQALSVVEYVRFTLSDIFSGIYL